MPGPAGFSWAVAQSSAVAEATVNSAAGAEAAVPRGRHQFGIVQLSRLRGRRAEHGEVLLQIGGLFVLPHERFVGGGVELRSAGRPAVAAAFAVLGNFDDLGRNGNLAHEYLVAQPQDKQNRRRDAGRQQQRQQHAGNTIVGRDLHAAAGNDDSFGFF